jgi:hypothetical protein
MSCPGKRAVEYQKNSGNEVGQSILACHTYGEGNDSSCNQQTGEVKVEVGADNKNCYDNNYPANGSVQSVDVCTVDFAHQDFSNQVFEDEADDNG